MPITTAAGLRTCIPAAIAALTLCLTSYAAATSAPTATTDPDGTVHLNGRIVPVPETVSPQARAYLAQPVPDISGLSVQQMRAFFGTGAETVSRLAALQHVTLAPTQMGGVRTTIVTPARLQAARRDQVLINLHGGGFTIGGGPGSAFEAIPIAVLAGITVVAVDYRLAPENPYPAQVDDTVAVYRELLKSHRARDIGIFGSSAGAILSAEVVAKLKALGLPLPAVMGFFSGTADLARRGDSEALFGLFGLGDEPSHGWGPHDYLGAADPADPMVSPIRSDLRGFPATLLVTSTRDVFLSPTANFERALARAGVETRLMVFDGLPHDFWPVADIPETRETLEAMAGFFDDHLGQTRRRGG